MRALRESILSKDYDIDDKYVLASQLLEKKINELIKYADSKQECDINKLYTEIQKCVARIGVFQAPLFANNDAFRYGEMIKVHIEDQTVQTGALSGSRDDKIWAYKVNVDFIDKTGGNVMYFELYYADDKWAPTKRNQKGIIHMHAYGGHPAHLMGGASEYTRKTGRACLLSNESLKKTIKKQSSKY